MAKLYNKATRKQEELDGDDLQVAVASGTHAYPVNEKIEVVSPNNERGYLPSENVQKAIASGYQIVTPTQKKIDQYVEENKGLKGAAKVALGQFVDEALIGLPELIIDKKGNPFEVAKKDALKREHELANIGGGIGGFGASMFYGGPLWKGGTVAGEKAAAVVAEKLLASGATELGKRTAMQIAKDLVAKGVAKTAGGMVEGALMSTPYAITEAALGDPEQAAETMLWGVGLGGVFGGATQVGKDLFKIGKDASREALLYGQDAAMRASETSALAARKAAKILTGVDEETILKYANNHERINRVGERYTKELVKDELDTAADAIRESLDLAKANEERLRLQLDQAYGLERQRLANVKPSNETALEIMGELENLKAVQGNKSDELFNVLAASDTKIDTPKLKSLVSGQMDSLRPVSGGAVFGDAAKAEYRRLESLMGDLDTLPDQLTPLQAKQIIKQIDPDINFRQGAGEFNELSDRNAKEFRRFLNKELRKTPEAAAILDEQARIAQAMSKASKSFGTIEKATSALNKISGPSGKILRDVLSELESVSGKRFLDRIAESENAKRLLDKSRVIDIRDELLPELSKEYKTAQQMFERAKEESAYIKRLTPERTQNLIHRQGFKNASIEDRRALEWLSQKTGKDYTQLVDDLNVFEAFQKASPNGSRRAVMLGTAGAAVGGAPGAAVGAAVGGALDYFGGAVLKKMIDGAPRVSGLLFAEKQMKAVAKKLDEIPSILQKMGEKTKVGPKTMSLHALNRFIDPDAEENRRKQESKAERIRRINEKSSTWASNQAKAASDIAQLIEPLTQNGAPTIGAALGAKYSNAVNYVFSQAPKPPRPNSPFARDYEWKPSDQEIAAFEQKIQVVMDPFSVFDDLKQGTLTRNHIAALKAVYPKMYEQFKNRVIMSAMTGSKPLSYEKRMKLSLLLETPLDVSMSPKSILGYQKTFSMMMNQIDPNNKKEVRIAQDMASDVQKIMG